MMKIRIVSITLVLSIFLTSAIGAERQDEADPKTVIITVAVVAGIGLVATGVLKIKQSVEANRQTEILKQSLNRGKYLFNSGEYEECISELASFKDGVDSLHSPRYRNKLLPQVDSATQMITQSMERIESQNRMAAISNCLEHKNSADLQSIASISKTIDSIETCAKINRIFEEDAIQKAVNILKSAEALILQNAKTEIEGLANRLDTCSCTGFKDIETHIHRIRSLITGRHAAILEPIQNRYIRITDSCGTVGGLALLNPFADSLYLSEKIWNISASYLDGQKKHENGDLVVVLQTTQGKCELRFLKGTGLLYQVAFAGVPKKYRETIQFVKRILGNSNSTPPLHQRELRGGNDGFCLQNQSWYLPSQVLEQSLH